MVQRNIEVKSETWIKLKVEAIKRHKNVREFAGEIVENYIKRGRGEKLDIPKTIILAAGQEERLKDLTIKMPTCMLKINGKTLLQRLIETFRNCGITDISVVKGYKKGKIRYPDVKYYYNKNYKKNKTLESLFYAESEMNGSIIVSYSDIWVDDFVVKSLLDSKWDITLVVDVDWRKRYEDRYYHPIEEAEKVIVKDNKVIKIGKLINPNIAYGEFVGLIKLSKKGVKILKENYRKIKEMYADRPFHAATSLEKAYITDFIQELIDKGFEINIVTIKGGYYEIDTVEDFNKAQKIIK